MNTKRVLVLGLIAGGFYVAACGSTSSNVGDTGATAGSSGKTGSSGGPATGTAGATSAGASGDGTSGASAGGTSVAGSGSSGASTGGASSGGSAGTSHGGASAGGASNGGAGSAGHAGSNGNAGSGGGINCNAVKCGGALMMCTIGQMIIPDGQCCPVCGCTQKCPVSDIACPQGAAATPNSSDGNVCCPTFSCPSPLCTGKACGASCATGEVPAECDASGHCITGGAMMCPGGK